MDILKDVDKERICIFNKLPLEFVSFQFKIENSVISGNKQMHLCL